MGLKPSKNKKDSGFHTNWDQNFASIGIHELQDDEVDSKLFNNRSLHGIGDAPNPYEKAMSIIGTTLAPFDEDDLITCFGFGDEITHDQEVFSFHINHSPCHGLEETLSCYRKIAQNAKLAGPTSYAPVIGAAIDTVEKSGGQYHVLLIISDGQVDLKVLLFALSLSLSLSQIVACTQSFLFRVMLYPLSIFLVRVGDGPWEDMKNFADELRARKCQNFQMVNLAEIMSTNATFIEKEIAFALAALMEIPFQYKAAVEIGILG
ncbi:hypothetical protein SO802_011082 [Lithocarpus litseifolius]|uniref:Copine C-terminal domain-containing protein n=1 Tax=Lithocarpus litseifolius TaxID=425828 RepID=A0AAW2DK78_9ROSI